MSFLRKLALAHQKHEGWSSNSVSQRNNNPGNLRLTKYQIHAYGAVPGDMSFAKFPTYEVGFRALQDDVRAKITGHSAHIDYEMDPTFIDYISVYAPRADGNDPSAYAMAIIRSLPGYNIAYDTPLTVLAQYLEGSNRAVDNISIRINYNRTLRAFKRAVGALKRELGRKLARLKKR